MRTTENLSLRLDPEVVRLVRRSAEERRQTLREFVEEALRRHVTAVTRPEEQANLISTVEEAFLRSLDQRLRDMLERVAALSAKEATDQAHALQILKRVLFLQLGDQKKSHAAIDHAWKEAVERVRSRGRPYPPEVAEELEARLAAAEKLATERAEQLEQAKNEAERARTEANRISLALRDRSETAKGLQERVKELEALLEREEWVSRQLEAQTGLQFKRRTAAELRAEHLRKQSEVNR